ncbi:MAG: dermonecrotic toxin domain-containing protein [Pseudomonas sp.]
MPTSSLPYFRAESLQQRFAQNLTIARLSGLIDQHEEQWLKALLNPSSTPDKHSPRVDSLTMQGGCRAPGEFASVLLISHPTPNDSTVYLNTLLNGLERFDNRQALLGSLQQRFAAADNATPQFEYEQIEGPVFDHLMLKIIDQQVDSVDQLSEQLLELPTLATALSQAFKQKIETLIPATSVEPSTHYLHIVQAQTASTEEKIIGTQTLLEALLDAYSGEALTEGLSRRYLSADGQTLDQQVSEQYAWALADTVRTLQIPFENQLGNYWRAALANGQTRRDYVAQALSESLRHNLLARREDGTLAADEFVQLADLLKTSTGSAESHSLITVKKLSVSVGGSAAIKLAGAFVVEFKVSFLHQLLFYSLHSGLAAFVDREALQRYFSTVTGRSEMLLHVSLNDHPLLPSTGDLRLHVDEIEHPLFADRADSVIALQKRNLAFVIGQPHGERDQAAVKVNDALDIRPLIDRRLRRLFSARWSRATLGFDDVWSSPQPEQLASSQPVTRLMSWLKQIDEASRMVERIHIVCPGVADCAGALLDKLLCVFGEGNLDSDDITVELVDALPSSQQAAIRQSAIRTDLTTLLLQRVTGYRHAEVSDSSQVLAPGDTLHNVRMGLTPRLLNHLLARAQAQFPAAYTQQANQFQRLGVRGLDFQMQPGPLAISLLEDALRIQLGLQQRQGVLDKQALEIFAQALNNPLRSMRTRGGSAAVEVYAVQLALSDQYPAVELTNVFIVRQPLLSNSKVLLWSPTKGLQVYDSLDALKLNLSRRLIRTQRYEDWLSFLSRSGKTLLYKYLRRGAKLPITIEPRRLDGHFIHELHAAEFSRQWEGIQQVAQFAFRVHADVPLFCNVMAIAETEDRAAQVLDALSVSIQNAQIEALMPDWIKKAALADLIKYAGMLTRFFLVVDGDRDFLFDIPEVQTYSRERVLKQLKIEFPDLALDPDNIQITLTQYVVAPAAMGQTPSYLSAASPRHTQSLTDYALNQFSSIQGGVMTLSSKDGKPLSARLTPLALQAMVRKLDAGAAFRTVLSQKLSSASPDYAERLKLYARDWPILMFIGSFQQKLEGGLSETAYRYLESIIEMPDNLARQPVQGQDIIFRQLQLIADSGEASDAVLGVYVIGPSDPTQGPLIVHAPFSEDFEYKEYASEALLLADLRTSNTLQALILQRLDPLKRARYEHGGFIEPHLPWSTESSSDLPLRAPGPITLSHEPVTGNVLHFLFEETLKLILGMATIDTVTTAESNSLSRHWWESLVLTQAMMFVPGKLGLLFNAWQSRSLLQASGEAAANHQWGRALTEFTAALSVMVSSRESDLDELAADDAAVHETVVDESTQEAETQAVAALEFSWRNSELPSELKIRLQAFEVYDVVLKDLSEDKLLNLFQDKKTKKSYAAVAGKVYEVQQQQGRWSIVSGSRKGPNLKLGDNQQWELDLQWGLRGGGAALNRLQHTEGFTPEQITAKVNEVMLVQASGLKAIRTLSFDKARRIAEAHRWANYYLENSLQNLQPVTPHAGLDARTNQILMDFFGVQAPSPRLINTVKQSITTLLAGLADPTLSPWDSPRFVVGLSKSGEESTVAFTIESDTSKRIFLTEGFFSTPKVPLKAPAPGEAVFNGAAHYRATTLLHELSHQVNRTHDIAYLEAQSPYLDLLADSTPESIRLKQELETTQRSFLSYQTPNAHLFKHFRTGRWEDVTKEDGADFILQVTGRSDLATARADFFTDSDKRCDIILGNADSLALLVTLLGRERFGPRL